MILVLFSLFVGISLLMYKHTYTHLYSQVQDFEKAFNQQLGEGVSPKLQCDYSKVNFCGLVTDVVVMKPD